MMELSDSSWTPSGSRSRDLIDYAIWRKP